MSTDFSNTLVTIFRETLKQAIFEAKQLHKLQASGDLDLSEYNGQLALDVAGDLKSIWASLLTGDKNNTAHNDEIFK